MKLLEEPSLPCVTHVDSKAWALGLPDKPGSGRWAVCGGHPWREEPGGLARREEEGAKVQAQSGLGSGGGLLVQELQPEGGHRAPQA